MSHHIFTGIEREAERLEAEKEREIGEALCMIFMILVSHENVKNVFWLVAQLPQRLKSMFFEKKFHSSGPFKTAPFEKFSKKVDFSLVPGK